MPDPPYEPGDTLRLAYTVTDENGVPVTPSGISLLIRLSATQAATYSTLAGGSPPIASAIGVYSTPWQIPRVGTYPMRWETVGPSTAEEFTVRTVPSSFFGS